MVSRCREQRSRKRDQQVQRPLGEDLEGRVVRGNRTNRKHVPVKRVGNCWLWRQHRWWNSFRVQRPENQELA